jgi:hypothetical protein
MKAAVLIRVEREAALEAIRALDAFGEALLKHERRLPKKLRERYREARRGLFRATGAAAHSHGLDRAPATP